jgi:hypothetical protein
MRTGRRHLPRKEKLIRKGSRDVPGVGANTTWHGFNHKEELCQLSSERTNQQTNGLNQVTAQAPLASIPNLKLQALMANMARNMANN